MFGAAVSSHAQSEGYIDTNFTARCIGNTSPRALVVQFDGKIIVGGNFFSPNTACVNAIDRMTANGFADNTFASPFVAAGDVVNAMALQGGKIIVAGSMRADGISFPLARLYANGSIDGTFQRAIQNAPVVFNALLMQTDGGIIAAGDSNPDISSRAGFIQRVGVNGARDNEFENGVITPGNSLLPVIAALAQADGGKILVGGTFTVLKGQARLGLGRLNANGSLDTNYFADVFGTVRALAAQPDGKILVAGKFTAGGFGNQMLARLNSNGTLDTSFQIIGGNGDGGYALLLQPDGKVVLGHSGGILRLTTNGLIDTAFGPRNADGALGTRAVNATSLALTANSNIIAGASSVDDGRTVRQGVTRLFGFVPPIPPPPVIVQQPMSQIVEAGTNVTFSVVATGAPPLSYQWRKNGTKINGATNSTYSIADVDSSHIGNYTVLVANAGGAVTSTVARLTVNFQTSFLTIVTNGVGAVIPDLTKKPLEIGQTYTVTARPAIGNLFSNWTGGATSSVPALTFTMQSNLVLVVNFVPSPFLTVKGVYNGLFFDTNAPAHVNAGGFTLTLDDKGGARGSVRMGTRTRKFKSAFSVERMLQLTLPATPKDPALTLALEADVANATIVGAVSLATNVTTNASALVAYLNPFSSQLNPAPNAGLFNAALPGADDPALAPAGDGFAALTVSTAGRVSGKGTLADGTPIKFVSGAARGAMVPVYAPLYNGRGSIFGWLTVTNETANDVRGTLWWTKPGTVGGTFYPAGFTNTIETLGSLYVAPAPNTPVLVLTNGVVIVSHGNLSDSFTNSIALGGDNRIFGDNQLALTISPAKGTLTGSFIDPATSRKRTVRGIALPQQNQARGFFLGTDQSGRVFIGEAE